MKPIAKHAVVLVLLAAACDPSAFRFPNLAGGGAATNAASPAHGKTASAMPTEDQEVVVSQITSLAESASAPTLSADGAILLFLKADGVDPKTKRRSFSLMGTDANGGAAPAEYTQDGVSALDPAFFPDTSGYAFVTDSMGAVGIVRTESVKAGASASMVAQGFAEPHSPSVAPDGGHIMFSAKVKGQDMVITVKPDGTMKSVLGPGRKPRYGPAGDKAVFVKPGKNNHAQIFTMSAVNGKGVTQVLSGDAEDDSPCFSPDGQYISFVSSRSASDANTRNLFIVRADGTGLKQITRGNGPMQDAFWGKDGRIYFSADPEKAGHTNIFVASMPKIMGSFIDQDAPEPQEAKPAQPAQGQQASHNSGAAGWLRAVLPGQAGQTQTPVAPPAPPQQSACAAGPCAGGAEECPNLPCRCNDGRTVNTRACNNACCAPANVACVSSCNRHGGYSGSLAGAQPEEPVAQAPAQSQSQPKAAFAKSCRKDADCANNVCVFKGNADMGYCTKECNSFTECPTFWQCENVRNGSIKYCLQRE
jgi:WD40-like Beta Propeller Repeat